jgi:sugar phosphate isomerase/epimerase
LNLAFSTNAFKRTSLDEAIEIIAGLGYAGVELMADIPHAYPPHMSPQRTAAVKAKISALRLGVSNVNAFTLFALGDTYHPSWLEPQEARRRQRLEHTLRCIELAAALGGKTISLEPGGPVPEGLDRSAALARYEAGLREMLPVARQAAVTLLVEPEPGLLLETAAEGAAFVERVGHPNLKMNFDLGHFFCVGEDPAAVLCSHRRWIGHVHLEDIAADRVHQHLIPGRGAMDFPAIFAALRKIEYTGWITVELYPYETCAAEAAREAFDFLQRFF